MIVFQLSLQFTGEAFVDPGKLSALNELAILPYHSVCRDLFVLAHD